jgi:hypothetical protein
MTTTRHRSILFTNLDFVNLDIAGVQMRTHANVLILSETDGMFGSGQFRFTCYLHDLALPAFEMFLDNLEYRLEAADSRQSMQFIGNDGNVRPLASGAIMHLACRPSLKISLLAMEAESPIRVDEIEKAQDEEMHDYTERVRAVFDVRVEQYWHYPGMSVVVPMSKEQAVKTKTKIRAAGW